MLKLRYYYKADRFKHVTLISDTEGIRDLYWQLTRNYSANDGSAIGGIEVTNLDGEELSEQELMQSPYIRHTLMSKLT